MELSHSAQDVNRIIEETGFHYIVVDTKLASVFEAQRILRTMLMPPRFNFLSQIRLDAYTLAYQVDTLLLYESTQASPVRTTHIASRC